MLRSLPRLTLPRRAPRAATLLACVTVLGLTGACTAEATPATTAAAPAPGTTSTTTTTAAPAASTTPATTAAPAAQATTAAQPTPAAAASADELAGLKFVRLTTSMGQIHLALDEMAAPLSVANYLKYVDDDHYDNTVFHRVMSDFMIQGGGFAPVTEGDEPTGLTQKATREGVLNEYRNGLSNTDLTVAMARLGRQPHSGTAQFFINVKDNPFLDQPRDGAGYAVFGVVVDGVETVQTIRAVPTAMGSLDGRQAENVPVQPVIIQSAERMKASDLSPAARTRATEWTTANAEKRTAAAALKSRYDAGVAALKADGTTTQSGLRSVVTEEGEGEPMPIGSTATAKYTGWMPPGWLFDTSIGSPTGDTFEAVIAQNRLIAGWVEGIPMMKKGETRWFEIPPDLAYGDRGAGALIPPGSTLVFEVTLVDFTPPAGG